MREYQVIRQAEGRGARDPGYYRALPYQDLSGRFQRNWRIRAVSYRTLLARVLPVSQGKRRHSSRILDLGAGNGWLSYRLSKQGHQVVAVDLLTNAEDGLGSHVYYDAPFTPVQAEFEHVPFQSKQFDLCIFNASFHYSTCYEATLREALRLLVPGGKVVIMDTPVYNDGSSGERMVRERELYFEKTYGFPSNSLPSRNYLTYDGLKELETGLALKWSRIQPFYGWRWTLKPWKAWLLRRREPAQFLLVVGSASHESAK
ncbi:MAG: class I SAM-dependent methyltransferase [Acidobacteriota bacterium]